MVKRGFAELLLSFLATTSVSSFFQLNSLYPELLVVEKRLDKAIKLMLGNQFTANDGVELDFSK